MENVLCKAVATNVVHPLIPTCVAVDISLTCEMFFTFISYASLASTTWNIRENNHLHCKVDVYAKIHIRNIICRYIYINVFDDMRLGVFVCVSNRGNYQ